MARKARNTPAGYVYHVLNRAAGRIALFRKPEDYAAFERILLEAHTRYPLPILAWCLMKNHWHFVVRPQSDQQITDFFRWLTHTHAMRWRVARATVGWGHLYQGRFKAFPVETSAALLTVCRYVERNALTANAVKHAELWRWGSLWARRDGPAELRALLYPWPVARPRNWIERVNAALTPKDRQQMQISLARSRPFGDAGWVAQTVAALGLECTVRREGRPAKAEETKT